MTVPVQLISTSNAAHWQLDAACQHADPEMFLPDGKSGRALRDIAQAKLICGICQVQERCLLWALEHGDTYGIWGGCTEDERRAIRATQARHR